MKNRPIPVIIVAVLFILVGCIGFVYHIQELFTPDYKLYQIILILLLRIAALVIGILLLNRINLARWLAVAWLAVHVVISAFNSTSEMIMHAVLLIIISVLLFLPVSNSYFKKRTNIKQDCCTR